MRRFTALSLAVAIACGAGLASAGDAPRPLRSLDEARSLVLENGLSVVLLPDSSRDSVGVALVLGVKPGSDATAVHTALASGQAMQRQVAARRGAHTRVRATPNSIEFVDTLPAHELELGLWLARQRLEHGASAARPTTGVHARAKLRELALGGAPGASAARDWFASNNAVLVLSGAFEPALAERLLRRSFRSLPRSGRRLPLRAAPAAGGAARKLTLKAGGAPQLLLGYALESSGDELALARSAAQMLNSSTELSLSQALASSVPGVSAHASVDSGGAGGLFVVELQGSLPVDPAPLLERVEAALRALAAAPAESLSLAAKRAKLARLRQLDGSGERARIAAEYQLVRGEVRSLSTDLKSFSRLTPKQLRDFVESRLTPARRSQLIIQGNRTP